MSDKPTEQQTPIRSRNKKPSRKRGTETQKESSEPTRASKPTKRPRETDDQTEKNEISTPPHKKTKVTETSPKITLAKSFQEDLLTQFKIVILAAIQMLKRNQELSFEKIRSQVELMLRREFVLNDMRKLHSVMPHAFELYWRENALYVRFKTPLSDSSDSDSYTQQFYSLISQFTELVGNLSEPPSHSDISPLPKSPIRVFQKPKPITSMPQQEPVDSVTDLILKNQEIKSKLRTVVKVDKNASRKAKVDSVLTQDTQELIEAREAQQKLTEEALKDLDRRYVISSSIETAHIIDNLLLPASTTDTSGMLLEQLHKKIVSRDRKQKPLREVKQHVQLLVDKVPEWCSLEYLKSDPSKAVFVMNRRVPFSKVREKLETLLKASN